jgi:hypothetical protein
VSFVGEIACEVKSGKLRKPGKLRKRLLGNRGSLRSHGGPLRNCIKLRKLTKMKKWMKIEEMVIGEQGLAALAWGKFEELYEIEEAHEIEGGLLDTWVGF